MPLTRRIGASIVLLVGLIYSFACSAENSPQLDDLLRKINSLKPAERAQVLQALVSSPGAATQDRPKSGKATPMTAVARLASPAPSPPPPATLGPPADPGAFALVPLLSRRNGDPSNIYKGCDGLVPLLRKDWKDIEFASCPQTIEKATGAQISYSNDRVKNNTIWAVNGTAALLYNVQGVGSDDRKYMSTGAYVTVNRTINSAVAQASSNADSVAYGGVFEFGVNSSDYNPYVANYFRIRGGGVEDHIKNTTAGSATFEWLPVYNDALLKIHSPFHPVDGLPLLVRFDPSLLVQYTSITGRNKTLAFNNMTQALRVGPQVVLNFYPGPSEFLSHIVGSVAYHWAYETYSSRGLSWFETNLTYNIDKDGYFGLTGSYKRGRDEDTGNLNNIYTISLTGKI